MERRKVAELDKSDSPRSSALPIDYTQMVAGVFTSNFDSELKTLQELLPDHAPRFNVGGEIFADEIVLRISLLHEKQLAATTVYASADFDPKASAPTAEDLLGACVDAIGALYQELLSSSPAALKALALQSITALEGAPLQWTGVKIGKHSVFLKVDKSNPELDTLTEDWLSKNDPEHQKRREQEQQETEQLFVTGASVAKKKTLH